MRIELIQDLEKFKKYERYWNDLLKKSGSNNPFLYYEWMHAWITCYPEDYSLYLLAGFNGDKLSSFAPLALDKDKNLVFMGYPYNDFSGFIDVNESDVFFDAEFLNI